MLDNDEELAFYYTYKAVRTLILSNDFDYVFNIVSYEFVLDSTFLIYVYDFMKYGEFDSHIPMNYKLWVLRQLLYDIDYSKVDLFNISDLNKQEIVEKVYDMVYDFSSYKEKVKKK